MKSLNYRCPFFLEDACWCDKALQKLHGVDPVLSCMRGKTVTCSWIEELASEENTISWGSPVPTLADNDASIDEIIGGLLDA